MRMGGNAVNSVSWNDNHATREQYAGSLGDGFMVKRVHVEKCATLEFEAQEV